MSMAAATLDKGWRFSTKAGNMLMRGFCVSHISRSSNVADPSKPLFPPNKEISFGFVNNRNPRNLERLRIAEKAAGWDLEKPGKSFWNKLLIDITGKHISAKVVHVSGRTPVSASTNEWCIKKFLYSTKDASAARAIGDVIAHRCLQVGITDVACFYTEEDKQKDKVGAILQAIKDGGVSLEEPDQIEIPWALNHYELPEKTWDIFEEVDIDAEEASTILKVADKSKT